MLCQLPHMSTKERKNCASLREGFSLTTYLMLKKINRKSQKRQTFMSQPFLLHQTGCVKKMTKFPWLLVAALWVTKMAACFHCAFCAVQSRNTITVTAVFWAEQQLRRRRDIDMLNFSLFILCPPKVIVWDGVHSGWHWTYYLQE